MILSEEVLSRCELMAHSSPEVDELLRAYKLFADSPYKEMYMMAYDIIHQWKDEISDSKESIKILSAQDKVFDRTFKFLSSLDDIADKLDSIRSKMLPKEAEDAIKEVKKRRAGADKIVV